MKHCANCGKEFEAYRTADGFISTVCKACRAILKLRSAK
jgi:DNA-directed RNA polymerase subunit RPC12/RpoP